MRNEEFLHIIGERIRILRRAKGMNQLDLSFDAKINTSYLSDIERGAVNPSISVLYSIAKALGIGLSELFANIPPEGEQDWQVEGEIFELFEKYRKMTKPKRRVVHSTMKSLLDSLAELQFIS